MNYDPLGSAHLVLSVRPSALFELLSARKLWAFDIYVMKVVKQKLQNVRTSPIVGR